MIQCKSEPTCIVTQLASVMFELTDLIKINIVHHRLPLPANVNKNHLEDEVKNTQRLLDYELYFCEIDDEKHFILLLQPDVLMLMIMSPPLSSENITEGLKQ